MEPVLFTLILPHTKPVMPFVSLIQHAKITMPDKKSNEIMDKLLLLNNSIFLKAEFAKQAFRIFKQGYTTFADKIDDGYIIKPEVLVPAWREIDVLIFELGSLLDFLSREINIAYNFKIPLKKIGFSSVVYYCKKNLPNEEITLVLCDFFNSDTHQYFRKMRNRLTHRLPFAWKGKENQFFYPDDPNNDDINPKTEREIDILTTSRDWLSKILNFIDSTSLIVFNKIAEITPYDKEDKEITWEELIRKQRDNLEKHSKDMVIGVSIPSPAYMRTRVKKQE
ncbi:hypothetical protein ES703_05741 [subsurface metagenome]